jgi:hypothetical protein
LPEPLFERGVKIIAGVRAKGPNVVDAVAIVEYKRAKPFTFRGMFGHYVPRETIVEEMKEAGYQVKQEFDFLPEQSFTIFSRIKDI